MALTQRQDDSQGGLVCWGFFVFIGAVTGGACLIACLCHVRICKLARGQASGEVLGSSWRTWRAASYEMHFNETL